MSDAVTAIVMRDGADGPVAALETIDDSLLGEGDVLVDIEYSSLNYKDGLALTGAGRIIREYPMIPGIDLVGTVRDSASPAFSPGDRVISTGWGVGERHPGGYSQRQRLRSEWLVPCPEHLTARAAMGIGTAGLTAMLCVLALEDAGLVPGAGPVIVTGAAGGVGSMAVALLAGLGHEVAAVTGRPETSAYLRSLGASAIVERSELQGPGRPLESETWAAGIDTVGSQILARVLAQTRYGGVVAACGLAAGPDLPTTVMPFILRGVRLQGVESVTTPLEVRRRAWNRLVDGLSPAALDEMIEVIPMSALPGRAPEVLAGQVRGRWVIDPSR